MYCHPNKQKTPRSDRLRQWYLDMLRMAQSEGIVAHLSSMWDTYFEGGKDHRMDKCSATFMPYLEGDYWPGARAGGRAGKGGGAGGHCVHAARTHACSTWAPTCTVRVRVQRARGRPRYTYVWS